MDDNTHPVSEAELDQLLFEAAEDLDQAWKNRMITRLLKDAQTRGDHEVRHALEPMLHQACPEHINW